MATLALCSCCGIDPSGGEAKPVSTNWPPRNPPLTSVDGEHTLVRGYLKRLNNNSADGEEKWVVRWIELERQGASRAVQRSPCVRAPLRFGSLTALAPADSMARPP